tara:strand:+ start:476 stop:634 length:159 start_codon:yes stop_codon:yes gene_type:complete
MEVTMQFKKDTKHTYVFIDETLDTPITQLYIHKRAFPDGAPGQIKVTVDEAP